jgi:hypothetical protein
MLIKKYAAATRTADVSNTALAAVIVSDIILREFSPFQ